MTAATRIELPNGYAEVRRCCINVADITADHVGQQKIYWGTIHSAKSGKDDAAWLQTQWGAPNILLKPELLGLIMEESGVDELEEFAGASFIHFGYLNQTFDGARTYLKPRDPKWFAVRLAAV